MLLAAHKSEIRLEALIYIYMESRMEGLIYIYIKNQDERHDININQKSDSAIQHIHKPSNLIAQAHDTHYWLPLVTCISSQPITSFDYFQWSMPVNEII